MFQKRIIEQLKNRQKVLENDVLSLIRHRDNLLDSNSKLKVQNEKLTHTNDMREEKIVHQLSMREERCDLENEKVLEEEKNKCAEKIREVKDDYRDKLEAQLKTRGDEMKDMYESIIQHLPKITAKLKSI